MSFRADYQDKKTKQRLLDKRWYTDIISNITENTLNLRQ